MRLNVYKLIYLLYYFRKTILERNFLVIIKEIKLKIARMGWISDIKLFNKFYYNKQWYKAIELGEEMLKSQKDNKSFLRKFGVAYFKINRIEKARLYIAQSLCLTINKDISHIVEIVEKDLITYNSEIYSQYDYIGGTDNLGFVKHKCIKNNEEYKYLTKIAQTNYPMDHYWNKESFFYEEVQKKYPEFKNITPQIINTLKMEKDKLSLMTFQELKNDNKDFDNIESVINLSEKISQTIKYDEAVEILKITDRGKATPLSSLMHKSWSHKLIFEKIKEQVRLIGDNFKLQELVGTMEYIIIDLKIYKKIKPKRDYMICHGDFDRGNIIFDKEENKMYVIDWSNYKLALRGYDLADYFQDAGLSFKEIKEVYLDRLNSSNQEEIRAKIFFIYQISILWIERLNKDNIEYQISNCIAPAINHMKELVTDKGKIREKRKMK